jgi:hypothetical protein
MAKGTYSADEYAAARAYRAKTNTSDFGYTDSGATTTHAKLDAKGAIRECRYSDLYPQATPVMFLEDVTGSLRHVPRIVFGEMPQLTGLLLRKGYAVDPQILFGAIGDATAGDSAPLQIGQFEADNEMDEVLRNLYLEGHGGGGDEESYELAMYFAARRVRTDAWEKDKRKGYLIMTGDEKPYSKVRRQQVASIIGDTIEADIPTDEIFAEVQERWNVYYIMPTGSQHFGDPKIFGYWQDRLGQNAIQLDDIHAICPTVALIVGLGEGLTDLDTGLADLRDVGSTAGAVVGKALATIGSSSGGAVVAAAAPGELDHPSGNTRL